MVKFCKIDYVSHGNWWLNVWMKMEDFVWKWNEKLYVKSISNPPTRGLCSLNSIVAAI